MRTTNKIMTMSYFEKRRSEYRTSVPLIFHSSNEKRTQHIKQFINTLPRQISLGVATQMPPASGHASHHRQFSVSIYQQTALV